jgi:Transposase IS66 family
MSNTITPTVFYRTLNVEGLEGLLQADAYKGYDALFRDGTVVEVACWAHARRRLCRPSRAVSLERPPS